MLVFEGSNFPTSGYTAYGLYNGAEAEGVIDSGSSVTVVFPNGVPLSLVDIDAVLQFRLGTNPETGLVADNT